MRRGWLLCRVLLLTRLPPPHTHTQIAVRLANAATEMAKRDEPDFFDAVVVNDDLDAALARLKGAWRRGRSRDACS